MEDTREKLAIETRNLERFKEILAKSNEQTREMSSILAHFDDRLSKLEETIQPVYRETGNLQEQQDNIVRTLDYLDYVIRFYTIASEVEPIVRTGPLPGRLDHYLDSLDRLQEAIRYFEDKNPESPELVNVTSLFGRGCEVVEKEFRQLLSRHSKPMSASCILDLVNDEDNASENDKSNSQHFPEKMKTELRIMSKWLCDYKSDEFFSTYAGIRSDVLLQSLRNLRDHFRSSSGNISQSGSHVSPVLARKSLGVPSGSTPNAKKAPKNIQQAFKKLQDVIPGDILGSRNQATADLKEDPAMTEREIVSYLTSVTALYKLMQNELKLMEGIVPFQYQKPIFSRLVLSPLINVVREGDELAMRVKRSVARTQFSGVLNLFPILRHQASMRHHFDLLLDGCSQDVVSKFQGLVINIQTTISKALNEFIDFVKNDADTKVPRDGTVHELTSNVMIFIVNLNNYIDILSRVIVITGPSSEQIQRSKDRNRLVYAQYITRVLSALGLTLKNKGEVYSDPFLRAIFMLNNFHYILKTLRKSGLIDIVHLFDREVELFYEEQILENKKEYSKSWSKIMLVVMEFDSKSLPTSPSGNFSSSNYDLSGTTAARLKDKDRQVIKDKFHVRLYSH